mgnify:FL=1
MKKRVLIFSMLFLLFYTLNYTYSSFKNTIVGDISATTNEWSFKATIAGSTKENDYYKIPVSTSSGSFVINVDTTSSNKNADYSIIISGDGLPSDIKFYSDSSYTKEIINNLYSGSVEKGSSKSITIYYKSSSTVKGNIIVNIKATIQELAMMKNGFNSKIAFWGNNYKPYVRTVTFNNSLSGMPSSCTSANLCFDVSYDTNQKKKVYAYLKDSGYKDSVNSAKVLYDVYIVSTDVIYAPSDCSSFFNFYAWVNEAATDNLVTVNFNGNFNTSKATDMSLMFISAKSLTSLNLSSLDTSNVTNMRNMFAGAGLTSLNVSSFNTSKVTNFAQMFLNCTSLTSLDLSNWNTSSATDMSLMFSKCSKVKTINVSNWNTSNVIDMNQMFDQCEVLTSLDLSSFNTSKVTDMSFMFYGCYALTTLKISNFNTSNVTNVQQMFRHLKNARAEITISNPNLTSYNAVFLDSFTGSNAKMTVNYTSATSSLVDKMIATKSSTSKVYKGKRV